MGTQHTTQPAFHRVHYFELNRLDNHRNSQLAIYCPAIKITGRKSSFWRCIIRHPAGRLMISLAETHVRVLPGSLFQRWCWQDVYSRASAGVLYYCPFPCLNMVLTASAHTPRACNSVDPSHSWGAADSRNILRCYDEDLTIFPAKIDIEGIVSRHPTKLLSP